MMSQSMSKFNITKAHKVFMSGAVTYSTDASSWELSTYSNTIIIINASTIFKLRPALQASTNHLYKSLHCNSRAKIANI